MCPRRLKHYKDGEHYDSESFALVADSSGNDFGDDDSDRTFWVFFSGWLGLRVGMKRFIPSTCLARAPFSHFLLTFCGVHMVGNK